MLDYISPTTLVEWVENTAPFLFVDASPVRPARLIDLGFEDILRAVRQGYAEAIETNLVGSICRIA